MGIPEYCNGLSMFSGMNFFTSCIQCPIKVGGHITIDGKRTESG